MIISALGALALYALLHIATVRAIDDHAPGEYQDGNFRFD